MKKAFRYLDRVGYARVSAAVALLLIFAASVDAYFRPTLVFSPDDTYITLHNALALRAGADPNFVGVSPLYGATSLLHLVIETALLCLVPPLRAVWITSWIGILLYGLGLVRLGFALKIGAIRSVLLALLGLTVGLSPLQLLNGLETGLALAAITWALAIANEERPRALAVLCGLMPLVRPELIALSGLLLAESWLETLLRDNLRATVERMLRDGLYFFGTLAPWLLFSFAETGHFLPSTMSTKRDFFCDPCFPFEMRKGWFESGVGSFLETVGLTSLGVFLLVSMRKGIACLLFVAVFLSAYWLEFPSSTNHYEGRYLYVLVPLMLYGLASGLVMTKWRIQLFVSAFLCLVLVQAVATLPAHLRYIDATRSFTTNELMPVAEWANANLPPDARVLVHDAGYISYGTKLKLTDLVGLKTPDSAKSHRELTWPSCGRDRALAYQRIARQSHATHLIASRGWDPPFGFSKALRDGGWKLDRVRSANDGGTGYDVYALTPPPPSP